MPTLEDYLFEINRGLKKHGFPDMDDDTLREVAGRVGHPEVMRAIQSGQMTIDNIVEEAVIALQQNGAMPPQNPGQYAEGGMMP